MNDCGHVSDCLGPPGGAQAGHRVAGEEIMGTVKILSQIDLAVSGPVLF